MKSRNLEALALLSLSLAGCTNYEKLATDQLAEDGLTEIALQQKGKGAFDFTAKRAGQACHGSITIQKSFSGSSTSKQVTCGAPDTCSHEAPAVCYEQGGALEKAGDYEKSRAAYGTGCDAGHAGSCNDLGVVYARGVGTAKDDTKALTYFLKACELKDANGCKNSGVTYEGSEPPKLDLAFKMHEKGCSLGSKDGCYQVGRAYMLGLGVAKDQPRAIELYEKACKSGVDLACHSLGAHLISGEGVKADPARGGKMLGDLCDKGDADSCAELGISIRDGKLPPKDLKRAAELFDKACSHDNATGCNELGYAVEHGEGVPRDIKRATELYEKGCDLGNATACSNFGLDLKLGRGIPKDLTRAAAMYDKACAKGMKKACDDRKKLP